MIKKIIIPRFLRRGITPNHKGFPKNFHWAGADTEGVSGKGPIMLQMCFDGETSIVDRVSADNIFETFVKRIKDNMPPGPAAIFFHYLPYDLTALLYRDYFSWFCVNSEEGGTDIEGMQSGEYAGVPLETFTGKNWFGTIEVNNQKIMLLDSFAFLKSSLKKIAKDLKLPHQKAKSPDWMGKRMPKNHREWDNLSKYGGKDAVVEWHVGSWIVKQHQNYDIRMCVSSPHMGQRVFRHKFLSKETTIPLPPAEVIHGAELAYHGGKNGFYAKPGLYHSVAEYDLVSAYPWAMSLLPDMSNGEWVQVDSADPLGIGFRFGIYKLWGTYRPCRYGHLFSHDFRRLRPGPINGVWFTHFEIESALKYGELTIEKCRGWFWDCDEGGHKPFKEYAEHFYKLKSATPKSDDRYLHYKHMLTDLYGKTIQTTLIEGDEAEYYFDEKTKRTVATVEKIYQAGGLYHPPIAAWITSAVRCRLHDLEHRYGALHSSTDAVKIQVSAETQKGLGGLELVTCATCGAGRGYCYFFRTKLYLHYCKNGHLMKYALHGFWGNADLLKKMTVRRRRKYWVRHMVKVREAIRQEIKPNDFKALKRTLDIDWESFDFGGKDPNIMLYEAQSASSIGAPSP